MLDLNLSSASGCYAQVEEPLPRLQLDEVAEAQLIAAARDTRPVEGLSHKHYRYPARFSPVLAAAAINAFTDPGDLVADPFVGGGTTLVEAVAARRRAWGTDISTLATFVTTAKTLIADEKDLDQFLGLIDEVASHIAANLAEPEFPEWAAAGYFRNLDDPERLPIRKAISQAIAAIEKAECLRLNILGRCAVLRATQWALETSRTTPSLTAFRRMIGSSATVIADGAREFASAASGSQTPLVLSRRAEGLEGEGSIAGMGAPRLILTSPPYPGVHVLYHRWQVDGRRETPAPFFIANALDGSGMTYYTMGGRGTPGLPRYFREIEQSFRSLAAISDRKTTLAHVVAFTQPGWQLPAYLAAAENAGWQEHKLVSLRNEADGRLWRTVPNRKWYADKRGTTNSAQEVVLLHRLA